MQVTQEDPNSSLSVEVDKYSIIFIPSPNFKNMKKFLKNRSDYTETTSFASCNASPEPSSKPKVERKDVKPVVVQPPLPPYPPPPDSPPNLKIIIKKEKEDEYTPSNTAEEPSETSNQEQLPTQTERSEDRPKKTICKEFIRGNCKRPVCKFAHEIDVSQLAGVYTFCWNYQNAVCKFPNCRFVHASVFEEAEFYRSGVLPPHARRHLKKPPPPPPPEEIQPDIMQNFTITPPPLHKGIEKQMPVISCIPASNMEPRLVEEDFRVNALRSSSPLKREWSDIDEFSSPPRDLEPNEHLVKKCKNCDVKEHRLQYNKEKVESMIQSSEEMDKKMGLLNKKCHKLSSVLLTLINPMPPAKTDTTNGIVWPEKDKTLLEQLNSLFASNNRISTVNDDVAKIVRTLLCGDVNLSNLMAKLLCSTGDQAVPSDTSRET